ncbi:MAG: GspH/FimT family pseudopilin [Betaproteobacteria bacterium]|nr:GspH/FimT family pseudopilin [Betaproteobacteria bacterium]
MLIAPVTARRSPPRCAPGFTLIEVVVVLAIMAITAVLAFPNFEVWLQNEQIRTVAESIQSGLQLAHDEAARQNQDVDFVLTTNAPTSGGVSPNTGGSNWVVRTDSQQTFIQGFDATPYPNVAVSCLTSAGSSCSTGSIVFQSIGLTSLTGQAIIQVSHRTNASNYRTLKILVGTGGTIRLCDPALSLSTNPQGCS